MARGVKLALLGGLMMLAGYLWLTRSGQYWAARAGEWIGEMANRISDAGIELLKRFEGFSNTPYRDAGGYSIGYGHYIGSKPTINYISKDDAENLLRQDISKAEDVIRRYVKVPLNQNQFDALVSFVYNVGPNAFISSTLLRKLNSGDYRGAADEMMRWTKSRTNGVLVENPALVARRESERKLFLA